jgi:hypothetical protein
MIIKFNSDVHKSILKKYEFSFFSEPAYLDCLGYLKFRNNEHILTSRNVYGRDYHFLFLPQKEVNYQKAFITFCDKKSLEILKKKNIPVRVKVNSENEYFYDTKLIVDLSDKKYRKRVLNFKKQNYILRFNYSENKIINFYNKWKKQKRRDGIVFKDQEKFFYFLLKNLKKYKVKQVYVEIKGDLVGFAWGIASLHKKKWIGVKIMSLYGYKNLGRFLHWERAKLFKNYEEFSLGTGCKEEGITQFKQELGPLRIKEYYYIETGSKK